jgi:redox-sensitive bicupin YhaK (pirin superfamily)
MDKYLHDSRRRGYVDAGWLKTSHSFSFGSYSDAESVQFGALRVLNDDRIMGGTGFDTHSHQDMEIITIPLKGELRHSDSTGGEGIIKVGDIQVMSAGTGVSHSEYNNLPEYSTELLQIWIMPEKFGIQPRYDQKRFDAESKANFFLTVAAGESARFADQDRPLWINQNAYISIAKIEGGIELDYSIYDINNGVFFFLIDGYVNIEGDNLSKRDSLEIKNSEKDTLNVRAIEDSYLLVIEVPID